MLSAEQAVAELTQFVDALMGDPVVEDMLVSLDLATGEVRATFNLKLDDDAKSDDVIVMGVLNL
jgi:hypothetical protein